MLNQPNAKKFIPPIFSIPGRWKLFLVAPVILAIGLSAIIFRPSDTILLKVFTKLDETPWAQPLAFNILQARTSLQKSLNIAHFPHWFRETKLPIYNIIVDGDDVRLMDSLLPKNVYSDNMEVKNRVFVNAMFQTDGFESKVEVRYRGALNSHWTHAKRSLLIKFPKENLFQKMKAIDVMVPRDRAYLVEIVNNERLKRMDMISPNMFFGWIKINGKDTGVYLVKERFSAGWLEKNRVASNSEIFSQSTSVDAATPSANFNLYEYIDWTRDIDEENTSFEELETLFYLLSQPDEVFYKNIGNIIELEKWYGAIALNILAGGAHSMEANLNLLSNSTTGKLEPLLEDIHIYKAEHNGDPEKAYAGFGPITKRLLKNEKFYQDYKDILAEAASEKNLNADLDLYDALYKQLKPEFYKDQTKYKSDYRVNKTVKEMRQWLITNYEQAQKLAKVEEPPVFEDINEALEGMIDLSDLRGFENFYDISLSHAEFTKKHPVFRVSGESIVLPRGAYAFNETIIIPQNTKLIIEPGTKIYLNENVSITSYSPIEAIGQIYSPITIARAYPNKSWGAVAIANTALPSKFQYVSIDGGSASRRINGVTFTGMLSAHNAPLYVYDSEFSRDMDDDVINVKNATGEIMRSVFQDTTGDAIDLDMTTGFMLESNEFYNIGFYNMKEGVEGDAIDISFSDALIKNNKVSGCSDKGISIGEKSINPTAIDNILEGCIMGIAVKDESSAIIKDNIIRNNDIGLSLYQKKVAFGGGTARLDGNLFEGNGKDFEVDEKSEIIK